MVVQAVLLRELKITSKDEIESYLTFHYKTKVIFTQDKTPQSPNKTHGNLFFNQKG